VHVFRTGEYVAPNANVIIVLTEQNSIMSDNLLLIKLKKLILWLLKKNSTIWNLRINHFIQEDVDVVR